MQTHISTTQPNSSLTQVELGMPMDEQPQGQTDQSAQHRQIAEEQQYRAGAYSLLAALLRAAPATDVLKQVAGFGKIEVDEDEMLLAMSSLGLAVGTVSEQSITNEYHDLFIGVGRGELVPYGSWYLTGFLMEQPLSILRDDLKILGIERDTSVKEPEDHIGSLFEVMAILISEDVAAHVQLQFFSKHLEPWCEKFFVDLAEAKSAQFYRSVGRFGSAFIALDSQYLKSPV
jgi:TorA maturation chaperone TorD